MVFVESKFCTIMIYYLFAKNSVAKLRKPACHSTDRQT
jgi:hypothetical protein